MIDCLSKNTTPVGSFSREICEGALHVTPPSSDTEVLRAFSPVRLPSTIDRPIWYARPAESNEIHGSVARGSCSSVCSAGSSIEQELNSAQLWSL
ncbi:MAG: hypothetical protein E6G41_04270 [Actinobacteria bacterium]|nr:MAG: hypothetical protein E6G41_04270 [Actinomycetota bacterium]